MDMIYNKVKSSLDRLKVQNKSILIAFSGGKDSMSLFHILLDLQKEYKLALFIAYINHNLRGKESDQEEKFVCEYINSLGLKLFIHRVNRDYWNNLNKQSIEMAARKIRYNFFNEIAVNNNIDFIATAHNLNDKIETFFINLLRANGIETLTSIPLKNKNIIRPLITVTRDEINDYIKKNNLPSIEDSTNTLFIYKRNIIRHKILPALKELHSNFDKSFIHIFNNVTEEQNFINYTAKKIYKKLLLHSNAKEVIINKKLYSNLTSVIQKRIIKIILKELKYPIYPSLAIFKTLCGNKKRYIYNKGNFICKSKGKEIHFTYMTLLK